MEEDKFTKCLRQEITNWACTLNSKKCTSTATYDLITLYDMQNRRNNISYNHDFSNHVQYRIKH